MRYSQGIVSFPAGSPFRLNDRDEASCWVAGFPQEGDVRRWQPLPPVGDYLTMPQAAACISAYLGRKVRYIELLRPARERAFDVLWFRGPSKPLMW